MPNMINKSMRMNGLLRLLMTTVFSMAVSNMSIAAQTTSVDGDASIVTYDKEYFIKYEPVTLLDMLQRVPGVPEILNENRRQRRRGGGGASNRGERGFGSGGDQILIDGKRLAGKANNIEDTLERVSADQVERVELIRGAASGLDVQSQGLVINIILKEGMSKSTTFWSVASETKFGHAIGIEGLVSHSGSAGRLDYTFSGERTSNNGYFDRAEQFFTPAEIQTGDKDIAAEFNFRGFKLNTNLAYNFEDGAVLRLNGLYEPRTMSGNEVRIETGDSPESILWNTDEDTTKWEFGGDYTRKLGNLGNLKVLFVVNRDKEDKFIDRFIGTGSGQFIEAKEDEFEDKKEKIFRLSVTKNISQSHTLEIGGEVAINTFDKRFNKVDRDLVAEPLSLSSNDNVEIKENRYEVFANHTYNISNVMVLQSSLTTEFSKIVADNILVGGGVSRRDTSFAYFKPRVNFRYDVTNKDQIRVLVEKKVSQLNFNNFVTRFDQRTEELRLGNTNIRPEQIWEFSVTFEHRLPNDAGSIEAEVFHRRYKDHISRVDFTEYEDFGGNPVGLEAFFALNPDTALRDLIDFTSKSGNIDKATANGIKLTSNFRLGFLGVPQATLSANYIYEKRRTTDQFTLATRNFDRVSDHTLNLNFRHDITDLGLSYGGRTTIRSDNATHDINNFWPGNPQPFINIFAEYTIWQGIKMRAELKQLTGKRQTSRILLYTDHIRFNEISKITTRQSTVPREIEISLQGTF